MLYLPKTAPFFLSPQECTLLVSTFSSKRGKVVGRENIGTVTPDKALSSRSQLGPVKKNPLPVFTEVQSTNVYVLMVYNMMF